MSDAFDREWDTEHLWSMVLSAAAPMLVAVDEDRAEIVRQHLWAEASSDWMLGYSPSRVQRLVGQVLQIIDAATHLSGREMAA